MSRLVSRAWMGLLFAALAMAGCDRAERAEGWFGGGGEEHVVTSSPGDARVDANGMLDFEVTSDLYRRWVLAQQALGTSPVTRSVVQLGRRALTQRDVDEAISKVKQDAAAAAAIRNAGLSPADYVFATISLEQAMAVAKGNFRSRNDAVAAAAAARNAEVVRQYEEDLLRAGAGDTVPIPPTGQYEPYPPTPPIPVPPSQPLPQPMPAPTPRPTPQPTPTPAPEPTPTPRPAPSPTPTPQPIPAPPRSEPVPVPTEPQPRPTEPLEPTALV